MTALRSRARTAESYLAELGLVGTLLAGGLVVFLLIVGLVTFDAWPGAAGLFSNDDSTVEAGSSEDAAPAASRTQATPSRAASGGGVATAGKRSRKDAGATPGSTGVESPSSGGDGSTSGGSGGSSSSSGGGSGSLGQSVSGAGNQVGGAINGATGTNAGDAVSGAGNTAGNAVSGLGL